MVTTEATEAVVALQAPKDVSLSEIESELGQIWLGVDGDGDAGPRAVRAATFTLVVYESPDLAAQIAPSVEGLAVQNPCRVIHLRPREDAADAPLEARVAAYCPMQKRGQSNLICCEYITLTGSRPALERSLGLINALLIGDLPTYLWWQAHPDPEDVLLQGLIHLRERGGNAGAGGFGDLYPTGTGFVGFMAVAQSQYPPGGLELESVEHLARIDRRRL